MTPKQQIRNARFVFIHFSTANGASICLNITKDELRRSDGTNPFTVPIWRSTCPNTQ